MSEPHPPIQEVISLGCLPRLVQFLGDFTKAMLQVCRFYKVRYLWDDNYGFCCNDFQFEAAWVLTNIASGSTLQTRAVIDAGAIPSLIQLLQSPLEYVLEQVRGCVW